MFKLFLNLPLILEEHDRRLFVLIFLLMLIGSLLEVVGLGSIIPLIITISNPEIIHSNAILVSIYNRGGFESDKNFILFLATGMFFLIMIKNLYLILNVYIQSKILNGCFLRMASRLFKSYLYKPYNFHLQKNTAQLLRNIEIINAIIMGILFPFITALTESLIVSVILLLMVFAFPVITLSVSLFFIILIILFHILSRKRLDKYGLARNFHSGKLIQNINQGLGGIKETKILGRESYFESVFEFHFREVSRAAHYCQVISQLPRFIFETVSMLLVTLILFILIGGNHDLGGIFVIISCFGLATARILPSLTRISTSFATIKFYIPSFNEVFDDLIHIDNDISEKPVKDNIKLSDSIDLVNLRFRYDGAEYDAISGITLKISKNSTVAFVGQSGAGKTTIIDLILGLHKPTFGEILSDGIDIQSNLSSWQRKIGYIPQEIFLIDDTIRRNVAFGLPDAEISDEKVWKAIELSQIDKFVKELPCGLDTIVGERGVRISGGQRQRIGIARALYFNPEILVMDEATAALDQETEKLFMDSINSLSKNITIIIIAHRLSTVMNSDVIYFLKNGHLLSQGTFDELIKKCPEFASMDSFGKGI